MKIERIAEPLVKLALTEDIGGGDVTTEAVIAQEVTGTASIVAREEGILAGLDVAKLAFINVDKELEFFPCMKDGERFETGRRLCEIKGSVRGIVIAERVALNFLQRMCGVATLTRAFVDRVEGTGAKITDTRKTTPALRILEKYAVKIGGGVNHRFGLFDMYLIKENHLKTVPKIGDAVRRVRGRKQGLPVEVEVRSLEELDEVLNEDVDRIMLDNMPLEEIKKAVGVIEERKGNKRPKIEASGGVTLQNVRAIASTGVDLISVGALTHSAKAIDLSLGLETVEGS